MKKLFLIGLILLVNHSVFAQTIAEKKNNIY
jgi:hypothetical protein